MSHPTKCICQICNCGAHKCQDISVERLPFDGKSNYASSFPHHRSYANSQPRRYGAAPVAGPSLPFEGTTTTKGDYPNWGVQKRTEPFRPRRGEAQDTVFPTDGDNRDFLTENRRQYNGEQVFPAKICRPKPTITSSLPFVGTTTNRSDFKLHDTSAKRNSFKPKERLDLVQENRDFLTEARRTYKKHDYSAPKQVRQQQRQALRPNIPFDHQSTNHMDFKRYENASRPKAYKPKGSQINLEESDTRDFRTEHRLQFQPKKAERARPTITKRTKYDPSKRLPFQGETTTKADYPGWRGARASTPFEPANEGITLTNSDERFWETENRGQFVEKLQQSERVAPSKYKGHAARYTRVPDDRDFMSETRSQLTRPAYAKREPFKPPAHTITTNAPFHGVTTNRADFAKREGKPAVICKPARHAASHRPDDRDFHTETSKNFRRHHISKCPTIGMPLTKKGGVARTHHMFQQKSDGRWTPAPQARQQALRQAAAFSIY